MAQKYYKKNNGNKDTNIEYTAQLMQFVLSIWYSLIKHASAQKTHDAKDDDMNKKNNEPKQNIINTFSLKDIVEKGKQMDPNDIAAFEKDNLDNIICIYPISSVCWCKNCVLCDRESSSKYTFVIRSSYFINTF